MSRQLPTTTIRMYVVWYSISTYKKKKAGKKEERDRDRKWAKNAW